MPRRRRTLPLTISSDLPAFSPLLYARSHALCTHAWEAHKHKSNAPFSEPGLRMQPRGLFVKRIFSGEHAGQRVLRVGLIPNKNMWNIFTVQTSELRTPILCSGTKRPRVYVHRLLDVALHVLCFAFGLRIMVFATNCLRAKDLFHFAPLHRSLSLLL